MNLSRRFGQMAAIALVVGSILVACSKPISYDVILRGGTIVDGSGDSAYIGDVAINGDAIAALGDLGDAVAENEIDVSGLAVAPGFTNMLSWSTESLIQDGRSQSEIRQGVTLQVFGEGFSMGPLNDEGKAVLLAQQADVKYDIEWNTLGEYLDYLAARGVSTNIASYIGAANPREYVIGYDDREPTPEELDEMRALVRQAMEEGAMGIASSLIYPPGSFAKTNELVELSKVAAEYDGVYASHIRNEGSGLLDAIDELITIAREADIRAEIYHYKVAGQANWDKFDESVAMIEAARAEGLEITADVYTYPAGAT
jgi:N-acyl-D-amino-acid deacylase